MKTGDIRRPLWKAENDGRSSTLVNLGNNLLDRLNGYFEHLVLYFHRKSVQVLRKFNASLKVKTCTDLYPTASLFGQGFIKYEILYQRV